MAIYPLEKTLNHTQKYIRHLLIYTLYKKKRKKKEKKEKKKKMCDMYADSKSQVQKTRKT